MSEIHIFNKVDYSHKLIAKCIKEKKKQNGKTETISQGWNKDNSINSADRQQLENI